MLAVAVAASLAAAVPGGPAAMAQSSGVGSTTFDHFGFSTAGIGDLDGDGVLDIAVGAPNSLSASNSTGDVYVMFMNQDGTVRERVAVNAATPNGPVMDSSDHFGFAVDGIGDLDGDGVPDMVVGAPDHLIKNDVIGDVFVLFMNADGSIKRTATINADTPNGPAGLAVGDHFGHSVSDIGDLNGDGIVDLAVGAPGNYQDTGNTGDVHILFMNRDGSVQGTVTINAGTATVGPLIKTDFLGTAAGGIGDLDGDGVPDMAIGASDDVFYGTGTGDMYIMLMNADGTVKAATVIDGSTPNGPELMAGDHFGYSADGTGDLDGDGVPDLAVGAPGNFISTVDRGEVHIIFMNRDGTVKSATVINDDTPNGPELKAGDHFGSAVASIGALNAGDRVQDLVVGTPSDITATHDADAAHILFLNADGSVQRTTVIHERGAPPPPAANVGDRFATSVSSVGDHEGDGDLDGDGVPDMVVGVPTHFNSPASIGAVQVILANPDGTIKAAATTAGDAVDPSLTKEDLFGYSVAGIGDLDGDGIGDIAAGAPEPAYVNDRTGQIYVLFLNGNGTVKGSATIDNSAGDGLGLAAGDHFGTSVSGIGDLDDDGIRDIVVGAPGHFVDNTNSGSVYVLFMNGNGTVKSTATIDRDTPNGPALAPGNYMGATVAGIGDLDGDGVEDIAAGAPNLTRLTANAGSLYLFFMNADGTVKRTAEINDQTPNGPTVDPTSMFGYSVVGIGDLDGDGITDLAASMPSRLLETRSDWRTSC